MSLPENDGACEELLQTLVEYLPLRYPTLFASRPLSKNRDAGATRPFAGILNRVTGEELDVIGVAGVDALRVISRWVLHQSMLLLIHLEEGWSRTTF